MDTEDMGPSPEEMGIDSDEKLTGFSTSKESDLFEGFVNTDKTFLRSTEVVSLEKEKFFVITKAEESDVYRRTYFAQARKQETEEITFQTVAEAFIKENQEVYFKKVGRPTGNWGETEHLGFTNEFREDKNEFDLNYTLLEIKQDERGSVETEGSSLDVSYDPQGNLFFVHLRHKDLPQDASFTSSHFMADQDNVEAMEEIRQAAEDGRILESRGMKLGVSYSTGRENFIFTMYNKEGEEDFTAIVPLYVNVAEKMEETGALNLLRSPAQPSEGIQGESNGDTDWKYKDFTQLTGVRLTPAKI